jgi:hypothetical protein
MADPAPALTLPVAIVQLLGQLAWPVALLIVVNRFRHPIESLLSRLARIKVAGSEWVFAKQLPAVNPPTITPRAAAPVLGPDGFLTVESLRTLVSQSGLLHGGEDVKQELLIFQTPNQRTWLLATDNFVFVLLDDEGTRSRKNLIQTYFEKKKTFPLEFGLDPREGAGIVKFGTADMWWYYSLYLFPTTFRLQEAVERLVT